MPPKVKSVQDVLGELRSKDKLKIGPLSEFEMRPEGMSTGNIALDFITGVGGYPRGRVVEQYGPPSSGKTTSALQSLALEQQAIIEGRQTGYVGFWDYEKSLDEGYCKNLGLDVDHPSFIYVQPTSFEHGANIFRKLLATGEVAMLIVDSVATMVTENELSAETGAAKVADRAKMMHQFLRQVNDTVFRTNTCLIFLNHTMELLDASPMGQKLAARGIKRQTQPGGKALAFYGGLRIEFKQIGNLRTAEVNPLTGEKEDQIRQTRVQATVVKNKVGDPFGVAELRVRWGRGFSQAYSILQILNDYGVVKRDGAGQYYFTEDLLPAGPHTFKVLDGQAKVKGEEQTLQKIEEDPSWQALLQSRAQALLDEHGGKKANISALYDSEGNLKDAEELDAILTVDETTGEVT
jgi:recombination protein RecA